MAGTIRINLIIGSLAFLLNLFFSLGKNIIITVLFRSIMAFVLFFLLAFFIRVLLYLLLNDRSDRAETEKIEKGKLVDMSTPNDVNFGDEAQDFIPLAQTIKERTPSLDYDPTDIANAIRSVMNKE